MICVRVSLHRRAAGGNLKRNVILKHNFYDGENTVLKPLPLVQLNSVKLLLDHCLDAFFRTETLESGLVGETFGAR